MREATMQQAGTHSAGSKPPKRKPVNCSGFWCSLAVEAQADEVHPMVLRAVAAREGIQLYTASLYAILEPAPDGYINIAIDPKTKEAYGLYHLPDGLLGKPQAAMWFTARGGVDEAVQLFTSLLEAEGIL